MHNTIRYNPNLAKYAAHVKVLEMIDKNPGRILDVGCASGYLGPFYRKKGAKYLVGLEFDQKAVQKARKYYNQVFIINLNQLSRIRSLPLTKASFDLLVCADILEHLINPLGTLQELSRFLKPGGRVIVSLPNIVFFIDRFQILLGRFRYNKSGGIMDETHLKFFNRQTALELVEKAGFKIIRTDHSRLGKLGWFPWLPNFFGVQTIILGKK